MKETERKDPRESKVVQDEYTKLCGIAGDKQYRVQMLKHELDEINQHLFSLNREFTAAEQKEKKPSLIEVSQEKNLPSGKDQ